MSSFCKCKSYSHFFSKNISVYAIYDDQTLTDDFVSFEQLGQDGYYILELWNNNFRYREYSEENCFFYFLSQTYIASSHWNCLIEYPQDMLMWNEQKLSWIISTVMAFSGGMMMEYQWPMTSMAAIRNVLHIDGSNISYDGNLIAHCT